MMLSKSEIQQNWLVVGLNPSEKYEFVNWDDYRNPILMGKCQIHGNYSPPTRKQSSLLFTCTRGIQWLLKVLYPIYMESQTHIWGKAGTVAKQQKNHPVFRMKHLYAMYFLVSCVSLFKYETLLISRRFSNQKLYSQYST